MSPNPGAQLATQTSARTLNNCLKDYLARPDVVERLKSVEAFVVDVLQAYRGMAQMASAIAQRAIESSPSIAYAPLLIENGVDPVLAQGLASLTIRLGTRQANESKRRPAVVGAIRFLAKAGRSRAAILRKAELLVAAWEETSLIDKIFDEAKLSESEFIALLKSAIEGRDVAWRRIAEIAAILAPHRSVPRGPKISAASAAHELLLEQLGPLTGSQGYTWDSYKEDFTDPQTAATRGEFARPRFSPQSAHRRLRRRSATTEG